MLPSLLFLTVIAAQTAPPLPPRDASISKPASCAISGRITEHGSNRPLPQAIVTLSAVGQSRRIEALTDAEGRYEVAELEAGDYAIWATPGEFRSTHLRHAFGQSAPIVMLGSPPRSGLELKPGERRSGVDIALTRALAIEGRVVDPWGEPMAEIEVRLTRADGALYPAMPSYSDDRGDFRLFGLAPGRYRVCAERPRSLVEASESDASRFVRTCHPAATLDAYANDVVLTTDDVVGIDIRIQRSATYSVSGSVVDAAGTAVDGAGVGVYPVDEHSGSGYATTRDGRFVVSGLTPGRYLVTASIGVPADPSDRRPPAREREIGYLSIGLDSTDLTDLVIPLSKGQTVTGRVLFEGAPAPPPSRLQMVVQMGVFGRAQQFVSGRPSFSAVTDNLTFQLTGLFRLPMTVGLQGLPHGWVLKSVRYDGHDITGVPTDLGTGAGPRRLEILLTNRVAEPSVRVTDEEGQPVTSYNVVLLPLDPARWRAAFFSMPATPSRDGVLKLGPRLPGDYLVAALHLDDYLLLMRQDDRIDSVAAVAARVTFAERDDRTVDLKLTKLPPRK